jgi:serine protease inhibitor
MTTDTKKTNVTIMHLNEYLRYKAFDDFKAIELPYIISNLCMVILLPGIDSSIEKLDSKMSLHQAAFSFYER